MASEAKLGIGTQLQRGNSDGPPETFTTIGEVKTISGPSGSRDSVDVTNMDSTGGFREFIAGLGDPGEITFSISFIPSNQTHLNLLDDFNNRTINNWQIVWPQFTGSPYLSFAGFVTAFATDSGIDAPITANCTIKVTGAVSLTQ